MYLRGGTHQKTPARVFFVTSPNRKILYDDLFKLKFLFTMIYQAYIIPACFGILHLALVIGNLD